MEAFAEAFAEVAADIAVNIAGRMELNLDYSSSNP